MSASNTARAKLFCQVPLQVKTRGSRFGGLRECGQVAVDLGKRQYLRRNRLSRESNPFPMSVIPGKEV